jgi:hypothetical protein
MGGGYGANMRIIASVYKSVSWRFFKNRVQCTGVGNVIIVPKCPTISRHRTSETVIQISQAKTRQR